MTEAKKKNKKQSNDNRISTHPAYTEYSWESLIGADNRVPAKQGAVKGEAVQRSAAATAGPNIGTGYVTGKARRTSVGASRTAKKSARPNNVGRVRKQPTAAPANVRAAARPSGAEVSTAAAETVNSRGKVNFLTLKTGKRYSFPLLPILIAVSFTVLIMAVVTTAVEINEITAVNSKLESKYNSMTSEENELKRLLEVRDDLRAVEQIAQEELGMVKIDEVEQCDLVITKEDEIEIVVETEEKCADMLDGLADFGNSVLRRIRSIFS